MKTVDKICISTTPPTDSNMVWVDVSNRATLKCGLRK